MIIAVLISIVLCALSAAWFFLPIMTASQQGVLMTHLEIHERIRSFFLLSSSVIGFVMGFYLFGGVGLIWGLILPVLVLAFQTRMIWKRDSDFHD